MANAKPCSLSVIRICMILLCGLSVSPWQSTNLLVAGSPTLSREGLTLEKAHALDEGASLTSPMRQYERSAVSDTPASISHTDQRNVYILAENSLELTQPSTLYPGRVIGPAEITDGGSVDFGQKSGKLKEPRAHSGDGDMSQTEGQSSEIRLMLSHDSQSNKGMGREKEFTPQGGHATPKELPAHNKIKRTEGNVILSRPRELTTSSGSPGQPRSGNFGLNAGLSGIPGHEYLANDFGTVSGQPPLSYHGQEAGPRASYVSGQLKYPAWYNPARVEQKPSENHPGGYQQQNPHYQGGGYPQYLESYHGEFKQYVPRYTGVEFRHQVPHYNVGGIPSFIPGSITGGIPNGIANDVPYGYPLATLDYEAIHQQDLNYGYNLMDDHLPLVTWVPKQLIQNSPFQVYQNNLYGVTHAYAQHPTQYMPQDGYTHMHFSQNEREAHGCTLCRGNNSQNQLSAHKSFNEQERHERNSGVESVKQDKLPSNRISQNSSAISRNPERGSHTEKTFSKSQTPRISRFPNEKTWVIKSPNLAQGLPREENQETLAKSYTDNLNIKQEEVSIDDINLPTLGHSSKAMTTAIPEAEVSRIEIGEHTNGKLHTWKNLHEAEKSESVTSDILIKQRNKNSIKGKINRKMSQESQANLSTQLNQIQNSSLEKDKINSLDTWRNFENKQVCYENKNPKNEIEGNSDVSSSRSSYKSLGEEMENLTSHKNYDIQIPDFSKISPYKAALLRGAQFQTDDREPKDIIHDRITEKTDKKLPNTNKKERNSTDLSFDKIVMASQINGDRFNFQSAKPKNHKSIDQSHVGIPEKELYDKGSQHDDGMGLNYFNTKSQADIPSERILKKGKNQSPFNKMKGKELMESSEANVLEKEKETISNDFKVKSVFDQKPSITLKTLQDLRAKLNSNHEKDSIPSSKKELEDGTGSISGRGSSQNSNMRDTVIVQKEGGKPLRYTEERKHKIQSDHTHLYSDDIKKGTNIFSEPEYITSYKIEVSPNPHPKVIKYLRFLGRLMNAEVKSLNFPIELSKKDMNNKLIDRFFYKSDDRINNIIDYLSDYVGAPEGGRRVRALVRQFDHNILHENFSEISRASKNFALPVKLEFESFKKVFRLEESWPTFSDSSMQSYEDSKKFLLSNNSEAFKYFVGAFLQNELVRRFRLLSSMSHRWYPEIWWTESELKEAIKQGLDVVTIIVVGDLLQFGKTHISLNPSEGKVSIEKLWSYLIAVWDGFKHYSKRLDHYYDGCSWFNSAERDWLLRDPTRASVYLKRITELRTYLRMIEIEKESLTELVYGKGTWNDSIDPWWNAADLLSWSEYGLDSRITANIGFQMNFKPNQFNGLNHYELEMILEDINIPISQKEMIKHWFMYDHRIPDPNILTKASWKILSKSKFKVDTVKIGIIKKELFHSQDPMMVFKKCVPYNTS